MPNFSSCARIILMAALGLALPVALDASILILKNGDRLTGTVVDHKDGKIYFHSDILDTIVAVPESEASIVDAPTPSEGLAGIPPPTRAASPPANSVAAQPPSPPSPATASETAPPGSGGTSGAPVAAAKPPAKAAGSAPVTHTAHPRVPPWTGKVEFGYDNQVSNGVRVVNESLRAETERTVGADNLLFKGRFLYALSEGHATTDEEDGEFRWRHNLSPLFFTQMDTTASSDKIQLIQYEVQQNAGVGYRIFQNSRFKANVGAGVTGQELSATGIQQGFDYLGNVFQDISYKINGRFTFTQDASAQYSPETRARYGFVPNLTTPVSSQARDYAYKFHSTLQGKLSAHLSLNLHFEYEFNNAILVPANRAEQRITTTLGYSF